MCGACSSIRFRWSICCMSEKRFRNFLGEEKAFAPLWQAFGLFRVHLPHASSGFIGENFSQIFLRIENDIRKSSFRRLLYFDGNLHATWSLLFPETARSINNSQTHISTILNFSNSPSALESYERGMRTMPLSYRWRSIDFIIWNLSCSRGLRCSPHSHSARVEALKPRCGKLSQRWCREESLIQLNFVQFTP